MAENATLHGGAEQIQAALVTAIGRLLSRDVPESEWRFELGAIRYQSGDQWEHRNAFLFSYTLARFIVGIDSCVSGEHALSPTNSFDPPDVTEFVTNFTDAVRGNDSRSALTIWAGEISDHRTAGYGPTQVASMFALYDYLRALSRIPEFGTDLIADAANVMPAPFGDDVWLEPVSG
ncbi:MULTISPECIES: hypothetical protein [Subtercola]|uniref:Uncharacterized protein n=1 Tax=Subtercola vilae TaxID=2056433 RepID=A0A4T2CBU1_9MICO|nr:MULTISPECIES: hypothetical protein [Subtercola]MEA9986777.1 hypothetical protein [Subtercola sp. RTI3]TIH40156.1 hypothetical protein D4765_03260 [Subtercola vilae]